MTGFGRGAASGENFSVVVEIKTVNNRYLDIHLRLSQELVAIEMLVRRIVSGRLSRGRVDVNINLDRIGAADYEVNHALIAGHVNALREIQHEFNLGGEIDINSVARLPGALTPARDGLNDSQMAGIEMALKEALEQAGLLEARPWQAQNALRGFVGHALNPVIGIGRSRGSPGRRARRRSG